MWAFLRTTRKVKICMGFLADFYLNLLIGLKMSLYALYQWSGFMTGFKGLHIDALGNRCWCAEMPSEWFPNSPCWWTCVAVQHSNVYCSLLPKMLHAPFLVCQGGHLNEWASLMQCMLTHMCRPSYVKWMGPYLSLQWVTALCTLLLHCRHLTEWTHLSYLVCDMPMNNTNFVDPKMEF